MCTILLNYNNKNSQICLKTLIYQYEYIIYTLNAFQLNKYLFIFNYNENNIYSLAERSKKSQLLSKKFHVIRVRNPSNSRFLSATEKHDVLNINR